LDDKLNQNQKLDFEFHLNTCADCRAELTKMKGVIECFSKTVKEPGTTPSLAADIISRIEHDEHELSYRSMNRMSLLPKILIPSFGFVGILFIVYLSLKQSPAMPPCSSMDTEVKDKSAVGVPANSVAVTEPVGSETKSKLLAKLMNQIETRSAGYKKLETRVAQYAMLSQDEPMIFRGQSKITRKKIEKELSSTQISEKTKQIYFNRLSRSEQVAQLKSKGVLTDKNGLLTVPPAKENSLTDQEKQVIKDENKSRSQLIEIMVCEYISTMPDQKIITKTEVRKVAKERVAQILAECSNE
jgi:hypothetical protein